MTPAFHLQSVQRHLDALSGALPEACHPWFLDVVYQVARISAYLAANRGGRDAELRPAASTSAETFYRELLEQITQDTRNTRAKRLAESGLIFWDQMQKEAAKLSGANPSSGFSSGAPFHAHS